MKLSSFYVVFCLFLSVVLSACSIKENSTTKSPLENSTKIFVESMPKGQLSDNVVPRHYALHLRVDPREESFSGKVSISIDIAKPTKTIWLHGKSLTVRSAILSSGSTNLVAAYSEEDALGVAKLAFEQPIPTGKSVLEIEYSAPINDNGIGLYKSAVNEQLYVMSQFQPLGARQVFPSFDTPRFKVPFDFSLQVPATDVAVTSTPIKSKTISDGQWAEYVFETTRPLPTYLIAFIVGPYDVFEYADIAANKTRQHSVPLRGLATKGQGPKLDYALSHTEGLIKELEQYFATPYPYKKLDIIAVPGDFGGAMEHVGAITYSEYLLLMNEQAPIRQRRAYLETHAHELSHQWFGNLVTPTWWTDLWLNESFATWMSFKVAQNYWPEGEFSRELISRSLNAMQSDSLAAARQIREPIKLNSQISGAFDGITYSKGGGVLSMLERFVGEEAFRQGVQLHMQRFADKTATADDFIASLVDGSGNKAVEPAFRSFIDQPGVPQVSVSLECTTEPTLTVSQQRYQAVGSLLKDESALWSIPFCYRYGLNDNQSDCILLNQATQKMVVPSKTCPAFIHPNADGAGYYRFTLDEQNWQNLIAQMSHLPASEALVLVDSVNAAFASNKISAEMYLNTIEAALNHLAWDVATSALTKLEALGRIIDPAQQAKMQQVFVAMTLSKFQAMNMTDSSAGEKMLYRQLQRFLIVVAKEQSLRKPLSELAAKRIGYNVKLDENAIESSLLQTTLTVGVQDLDDGYFDTLLERALSTANPSFEQAALGALARTTKPNQLSKLQAGILSKQIQGAYVRDVLFEPLKNPALIDGVFTWFVENYLSFFDIVPTEYRGGAFSSFGRYYCDADKAKKWENFMLEMKDEMPGYERPFRLSKETIALCSALKNSQQQNIIEQFDKLLDIR